MCISSVSWQLYHMYFHPYLLTLFFDGNQISTFCRPPQLAFEVNEIPHLTELVSYDSESLSPPLGYTFSHDLRISTELSYLLSSSLIQDICEILPSNFLKSAFLKSSDLYFYVLPLS